jgi:hypothetical protein
VQPGVAGRSGFHEPLGLKSVGLSGVVPGSFPVRARKVVPGSFRVGTGCAELASFVVDAGGSVLASCSVEVLVISSDSFSVRLIICRSTLLMSCSLPLPLVGSAGGGSILLHQQKWKWAIGFATCAAHSKHPVDPCTMRSL